MPATPIEYAAIYGRSNATYFKALGGRMPAAAPPATSFGDIYRNLKGQGFIGAAPQFSRAATGAAPPPARAATLPDPAAVFARRRGG